MSTADQENNFVPPSGRRLALVVGVNGSPQIADHLAPLQFAENSATALAPVLRENCDFELLKLLIGKEATKLEVEKAIRELAKQRTDQDFLLFYFAGHGYPMLDSAQQRNVYLVTQDFDPAEIEESHDNNAYLSLSWLSQILYTGTRAGSVLIILDCCYGGDSNASLNDRPLDTIYAALIQYFSSPSQAEGKTRATLSAAGRGAVAWESDGYSLMAKCLLGILRGRYQLAVDEYGQVTLGRLVDTLQAEMPDSKKPKLYGNVENNPLILATHKELSAQARREREYVMQSVEREQRLLAMFDRRGFIQDRLASFVGREKELGELDQRIQALLPTGGYITITGLPGQGKSSIIAKLIETYSKEQGGFDRVAYHFIPLSPGSNHQVALLQNLLARLILKHDLSEIHIESVSHAVMSTLSVVFLNVLKKINEKGKQEIIFIDGLDQLTGEAADDCDLSFLPQGPGNLPAGIVFILGTRPNDILRSLNELLKSSEEYQINNISRDDFDGILHNRHVSLDRTFADSFYEKLEENALYLDLAAKELAVRTSITPQEIEEIIRHISDNPENLFSLSINRMRSDKILWKEVMKPILGLLLVTNEPLSRKQIKQLINLNTTTQVDGEQLGKGLRRLGGLIVTDGHQRYTLFHLKFRDYLREDPTRPDKDSIFDTDDERHWQKQFVIWCELDGLERIWDDVQADSAEQQRRQYARQYYVTHLYQIYQEAIWERLFNALDDGAYGKAKVLYDPSTRSYALDLDLGRQAAASDRWGQLQGIQHLPHLWRYTLLRCSLASRADKYPSEAFRLMLLMGQESKAQGLAELITDPVHKVEVFTLIASHIATSLRQKREARQMLMRAEEIAKIITDDESRIRALVDIASSYASTGQEQQARNIFQQAENTVSSMKQGKKGIEEKEIEMLIDLASAYASIGQGQQVQRLTQQINEAINSKDDAQQQTKLLTSLASAYALIGQQQQVRQLGQQINEAITTLRDVRQHDNALAILASASAHASLQQQADEAITSMSDVRQSDSALTALVSAYAYTERWQKADIAINSISDESWRITALIDLALAYIHKEQLQQARQILQKVDNIISTIRDTQLKDNILGSLAKTYVYGGDEQQTEIINSSEGVVWQYEDPHITLAKAYVYGEDEQQTGINSSEGVVWRYEHPLITLAKSYSRTMPSQEVNVVVPSLKDKSYNDNALFVLVSANIQNVRVEEIKHPYSIFENTDFADTQAKLWKILSTQISSQEEKDTWQFDYANILLAVTYAQVDNWPQVEALIASIRDNNWREKMWVALTATYVQKSWWQQAEAALAIIKDVSRYNRALIALVSAYAEAKQWQQAEDHILRIQDKEASAKALTALADAFAKNNEYDRLLHLIHEHWLKAHTRDQAIMLLPLAFGFVPSYPDIGIAFRDAFAWVDDFLRG